MRCGQHLIFENLGTLQLVMHLQTNPGIISIALLSSYCQQWFQSDYICILNRQSQLVASVKSSKLQTSMSVAGKEHRGTEI